MQKVCEFILEIHDKRNNQSKKSHAYPFHANISFPILRGNIRKPEVLWCFQTVYEWNLCVKWVVSLAHSSYPPPPAPLWWSGWGARGEGELSHFSKRLYRRDLVQIGILGGNWHFRWGWYFLVGLENFLYKK